MKKNRRRLCYRKSNDEICRTRLSCLMSGEVIVMGDAMTSHVNVGESQRNASIGIDRPDMCIGN